MLRHKPDSCWQTLYVSKIRNPKPVDAVSRYSILLAFDKNDDFLIWEQKLRKYLEGNYRNVQSKI